MKISVYMASYNYADFIEEILCKNLNQEDKYSTDDNHGMRDYNNGNGKMIEKRDINV